VKKGLRTSYRRSDRRGLFGGYRDPSTERDIYPRWRWRGGGLFSPTQPPPKKKRKNERKIGKKKKNFCV
jgi:hypothetical protein